MFRNRDSSIKTLNTDRNLTVYPRQPNTFYKNNKDIEREVSTPRNKEEVHTASVTNLSPSTQYQWPGRRVTKLYDPRLLDFK